ncbi:MAG: hypothetical protein A6D92_15270, partial [Symbiobacterium thermophilum]
MILSEMMPMAPMGPMGQMPYVRPGWPMAPQMRMPSQRMMPPGPPPELMYGGLMALPQEQSYLENILRMNRGKVATIYATYDNNPEWPARVFRGEVENAARDHVVLSDPQTGMRYVILMVNIDYLTFDEPLRYPEEIYRPPG